MADFGGEQGKPGYNKVSLEYKSFPSIETYVRLRREYPKEELEIATTAGLDFVFAYEDELKSNGIEPKLFTKALDADLEAQAELALDVMVHLISRNETEKTGAPHLVSRKKAISDAFVNYLIGVALDALSWTDQLTITRELIVLIKHQLGALTSHYIDDLEIRNKKFRARWIAGLLIRKGERPSLRKIAKCLGVQASTVKRWFADEPPNFNTDIADEIDEISKDMGRWGKAKAAKEKRAPE